MNDETFALRVFFHHSAFSLQPFLFSPYRADEKGGTDRRFRSRRSLHRRLLMLRACSAGWGKQIV